MNYIRQVLLGFFFLPYSGNVGSYRYVLFTEKYITFNIVLSMRAVETSPVPSFFDRGDQFWEAYSSLACKVVRNTKYFFFTVFVIWHSVSYMQATLANSPFKITFNIFLILAYNFIIVRTSHPLLPIEFIFHLLSFELVSLTLRRLMSCIYGAPILDVSRSHTTTQHSR